MSQDANDFLMSGGGKSASFAGVPPISIRGKVKSKPTTAQQHDITSGEPKFWGNGDPVMQMIIPLATDERDPSDPQDDGTRVLYVSGAKQKALRDAVRKAGAQGVEVGGEITMTYTADDTTKEVKRGMNRPKLYEAAYASPNPLDAASAPQEPNVNAWGAPPPPAASAAPTHRRPANIPEAVWSTLPDATKATLAATDDTPPF